MRSSFARTLVGGGWLRVMAAAGVALIPMGVAHGQSSPQSLEALSRLSVEELGGVEITSVSKRPQPLSNAAAAIYVISHDDIVRSGATSLPEILRMAPNLQIAQTSPSNYVITARGFSGNTSAQNFSDKLLVLIDGRSVYTPLYSGVYWDMQDVLPDDIERIEVISGPGATLWGANAVNGVINITTRKSADTQGGILDLGIGNLEGSASLQYGGRLSDDLTYRVYAKAFARDAYDGPNGTRTHDGWSKPQGGFRLDWTPDGDMVTVQGDLYQGAEEQGTGSDQLISGGNLQTRWQHQLDDGSNLQVQAYYDQTRRSSGDGGGSFILRTYDLEAQHSFQLADWNAVVWGIGDRVEAFRIAGQNAPASSLLFQPADRNLNLGNIFAQDQIALGASVQLTLGLKLEDDPYSGLSPMPSIRVSWTPDDGVMLWGAVSRAIRSPTPFDRDVIEKLGPTPFLIGGPDFLPETLTAYELGYRGQLSPRVTLSVSAFRNVYDDLKTVELAPTGFLPLQWGNEMEGTVTGLEVWGSYQATDWWRLNAGFNVQHESLRFKPGSSQLLGIAAAGDDPRHQASLRSSMNLSDTVTFDADLRYVGMLPNPRVPEYAELNARLGWRPLPRLEISLSGFNLLHDKHQESDLTSSDEIPRSFFVETRWKF